MLRESKKPKKGANLLQSKTSFLSKTSSDLKAKGDEIRASVAAAVEKLQAHKSATIELSSTDKMARQVYLKNLIAHLLSANAWQALEDSKTPDVVKSIAEEVSLKLPEVAADGPNKDNVPILEGFVGMKFPQFFRSESFMSQFAEKSFDAVGDMKQLDKKRLQWARMQHCLVVLVAGVKHSTSELSRHIKAVENAVVKTAAKEKAAEEKKATQAAKQEAADRAKAIKQSGAAGGDKKFFDCPDEVLHIMKPVKMDKELAADTNFDVPFVITENSLVREFMADKTVTLVTSSYGARYVKQEVTKKEGKHSQPFAAGQGKEQSEALFASIMSLHKDKIVDISKVASSFNNTTWLFGCMKGWESCGLTPNCAGCFKMLVFGTVTAYVIDTELLLKHLPTLKMAGRNTAELYKIVQAFTAEQVQQLKDLGVPVYKCHMEKEMILWVPAGWLLLEKTGDSALTYGIRKSMFITTSSLRPKYEAAKLLLQASGNVTDVMSQVAGCFP